MEGGTERSEAPHVAENEGLTAQEPNRDDSQVTEIRAPQQDSETISYNEPPPPYTPGEYGERFYTQQPQAIHPPYPTPTDPYFQMPSNQQPTQMHTATGRTVIAMPNSTLGEKSTHIRCPHCHANVLTRVESSPGCGAWLLSGLCCIFGCWFGCCLVPFCIPELQEITHYCPSCKSAIGSFQRF